MGFRVRLLVACGLVSGWMILLMTGFVLGGWSHLVLLAALAAFPWRGLPKAGRNPPPEPP